MLQFICLFFPALISMQIFHRLRTHEKEYTILEWISQYGIFTLLDTTAVLAVMRLFRPDVPTVIDGRLNDSFISVLYLAAAIVISVVIGYGASIAREYIHLSLKLDDGNQEEQ